MSANAAKDLNNYFSEIIKHGQNGDWDRAIKVVSKLTQHASNDPQVLQCKIVTLIHLGRFQEAVNVISRNQAIAKDLVFEHAYCLYRLNQIQEAHDVLQGITVHSEKTKELLAQVLYRLEKYEECYEIYRDLIKNSNDEYEDERSTNLASVIANLHAIKSKYAKDAPQLEENTYELMYNSACSLIAQKKYSQAKEKLEKAEGFCKKFLEEDDVAEDEVEAEVAIIKVQQGYALQMLGKDEEAGRLYAHVLKQKPTDIGLIAVASNNIVCINKDQNVFESKKKIKAATTDGLEHKLTNQQRISIAVNQCLLSIQTSQGEQVKQQVEALKKKCPDNTDVILIEAAYLCKEKQMGKAIKLLQDFAALHPNKSLDLKFCMVQLLISNGEIGQACTILKSLGDISFKPGVVSTLVSLYLSMEDTESAALSLNEAVEWYKKNKPKSPELALLWRESADLHIASGSAELAAKSLEELRKANPKDMKTLAQLITAYSEFDSKKAQLVSKDLPPVAELVSNIDVDQLETTNWIMGTKYLKKTGKLEVSPNVSKSKSSGDALLLKKKRKKKKSKIPKNVDTSIPPDPERWLPKRERSTYKKRKDRRAVGGGGAGGIGKGTQGSTTGNVTEIDATKTAFNASSPRANPSPGTTTANTLGSQGPRQQRSQPVQKKKKKKGGR